MRFFSRFNGILFLWFRFLSGLLFHRLFWPLGYCLLISTRRGLIFLLLTLFRLFFHGWFRLNLFFSGWLSRLLLIFLSWFSILINFKGVLNQSRTLLLIFLHLRLAFPIFQAFLFAHFLWRFGRLALLRGLLALINNMHPRCPLNRFKLLRRSWLSCPRHIASVFRFWRLLGLLLFRLLWGVFLIWFLLFRGFADWSLLLLELLSRFWKRWFEGRVALVLVIASLPKSLALKFIFPLLDCLLGATLTHFFFECFLFLLLCFLSLLFLLFYFDFLFNLIFIRAFGSRTLFPFSNCWRTPLAPSSTLRFFIINSSFTPLRRGLTPSTSFKGVLGSWIFGHGLRGRLSRLWLN